MNVGGLQRTDRLTVRTILRFVSACAFTLLFAAGAQVAAQSTDQAFPTAITSTEISGTIPARDLGDPRLTTFYFAFEGKRGDVFINIYTTNFNGAIDIFTAQGLDPRTKITIYSDNPERETGRVIYQRRDEKLILRIQGRTPNDDPATYRLKFAGSFSPLASAADAPGEMPSVSGTEGVVPVNSAGGIVPAEPGTGERKAADRANDRRGDRTESSAERLLPERPDTGRAKTDESTAKRDADENPVHDDRAEKPSAPPQASLPARPVVVVTDELRPPADTAREVTVEVSPNSDKDVSAVVTIERAQAEDEDAKPAGREGQAKQPDARREGDEGAAAKKEAVETGNEPMGGEKAPANPLDRIFLRVELKDGTKFERRMSEVLSVNVMNGILVIVTNDGRREVSILDVVKMIIE